MSEVKWELDKCGHGDWCIYSVLWTERGSRKLIDTPDIELAAVIAIELARQNMLEIHAVGGQIMEIDKDMPPLLRQRLERHINGYEGETVARLRLELRERTESAEMANQLAAAYREGNR